jgi:hypothetical protein
VDTYANEKERAKQIIVEIVRLYGGRSKSKTGLFKAFYFAHLFYVRRAIGYLSNWPIVKMPGGPGIEQADKLLQELVDEGKLTVRIEQIGPYDAIQYEVPEGSTPADLSLAAIDAIREAVVFVKDKTATELSDLTHEFSRSWNNAEMGDELNVYIDIPPKDVYEERRAKMKHAGERFDQFWAIA